MSREWYVQVRWLDFRCSSRSAWFGHKRVLQQWSCVQSAYSPSISCLPCEDMTIVNRITAAERSDQLTSVNNPSPRCPPRCCPSPSQFVYASVIPHPGPALRQNLPTSVCVAHRTESPFCAFVRRLGNGWWSVTIRYGCSGMDGG